MSGGSGTAAVQLSKRMDLFEVVLKRVMDEPG